MKKKDSQKFTKKKKNKLKVRQGGRWEAVQLSFVQAAQPSINHLCK